jgi:photosynthetic reaction center H subunit
MGFSSSIDLAEILFTLFWVFFIALVFYLHRESKREGYPLETDHANGATAQGFPGVPDPKTYLLPHGGEIQLPKEEAPLADLPLRPVSPYPGAPFEPTSENPMLDGVGPGSWANRLDEVELTLYGEPRFVPMRTLADFHVDSHDPDPRGMFVLDQKGEAAGKVVDLWVDRIEPMIVFFEVDLRDDGPNVLLPINFSRVQRSKGIITVRAIYAHQFKDIPKTAANDQITALEEEKILAYFGAGTLYADSKRVNPLI